jgi:hypothetical protein
MPKVQGHDSIDLAPKRTQIGIKLERHCKYQYNAVMFQLFALLKRNQKVEIAKNDCSTYIFASNIDIVCYGIMAKFRENDIILWTRLVRCTRPKCIFLH